MKHNHINEALSVVVPMLFNHLDVAGFVFDDDESNYDLNMKDGALIVESIRALLCKHYGMFHPFHAISEDVFELVNEEEFKIVDELAVDLRNKQLE